MLEAQLRLLLLVTGLATTGALLVFLAPARSIRVLFGVRLTDPTGLLIAGHWGLLVFLVGILLVLSAFHPEMRAATLLVASVEKGIFCISVLLSPLRLRLLPVVMALADGIMSIAYACVLAI